jgi:hypothetical protein
MVWVYFTLPTCSQAQRPLRDAPGEIAKLFILENNRRVDPDSSHNHKNNRQKCKQLTKDKCCEK